MWKQKYKITNWSSYNESLKKRGSLTVWLEEGFEHTWYEDSENKKTKRGRPLIYSNSCIKVLATVRHIFKLALRQLEGFLKSLFVMLKIDLCVPEFSRLSRRMTDIISKISFLSVKDNIHLVIDSSGIKVYGEREWIRTKKGINYCRRIWRKLHIGIDGSGFIRASEITFHKTNDRSCFETIVDKVGTNIIDETLADSGYDSHRSYDYCKVKEITLLVPPPKNARISFRKGVSRERNETISYINENGIYAWKSKNNFGRRNRVENSFYRIKTIFGRQFLSRMWKNQEKESQLICSFLNKMTSLGMPKSVKIA